MPKRTYRNRRGGGKNRVTFRNNVKSSNNSNNYSRLPNSYLTNIHELFPYVTNYHANNAEILAGVKNTYNDPINMKRAIHMVYDPQPLTEQERGIANKMLSRGIPKGINRIAYAPIPEYMKARIINYLRYKQQIAKIEHTYETEHIPRSKYVHSEWNAPQN